MTLDCSRIAKEIATVSGFFVEGGRQTLLYSDTDKKDQKNLCGKLKEVEYCPKQDDHKVINHETPEK